MENRVGKVALALSSRIMGALPNSTETPSFTSEYKSIETYKVVKLRNGKEYEGSSSTREEPLIENMTTSNTSEVGVSESSEATPLTGPTEEHVTKDQCTVKIYAMISNPEKQPIVMPKVDNPPIFFQERPPHLFPQRIRKDKEDHQFTL